MKQLYGNIKENREVRKSLSDLRKFIKNEEEKEKFIEFLNGDYEVLIDTLRNEDGKSRKNGALLLGDLGFQEFLAPLYQAYEKEQQLFVRSAYLQGMKQLDFRKYLDKFKERQVYLSKEILDECNKKHVLEEMRELSEMILVMEGVKMHSFCGDSELSDIILLTNRRNREVTFEELRVIKDIDSSKIKMMSAGLRLSTNCIKEILTIRTYQDLLFLVPGMKTCAMHPESAAKTIVESKLFNFLQKRHSGKAPFYFRVEMKSKLPMDKRSAFVKKLSSRIEQLSDRKFINTTSQYEFEIRLIENKEGTCNVMVKLYTIADDRFSYRTEIVPTSIKPVNAALLVALAKFDMVENKRVLDPFCGVGTMLIERQKKVPANTSYGIDVMPSAIEGARINTKQAGQIVHYINKDYFSFTHAYLFDEIFTNMPFAIGHKSEEAIEEIYASFFVKSREHLEQNGKIILYTHNREFVQKYGAKSGFRIVKEFEINIRENTYLMILQ